MTIHLLMALFALTLLGLAVIFLVAGIIHRRLSSSSADWFDLSLASAGIAGVICIIGLFSLLI